MSLIASSKSGVYDAEPVVLSADAPEPSPKDSVVPDVFAVAEVFVASVEDSPPEQAKRKIERLV